MKILNFNKKGYILIPNLLIIGATKLSMPKWSKLGWMDMGLIIAAILFFITIVMIFVY